MRRDLLVLLHVACELPCLEREDKDNSFFFFNRKAERHAILHVKNLLHNHSSRSVLLLPVAHHTQFFIDRTTIHP
jgi:hypothetical protein